MTDAQPFVVEEPGVYLGLSDATIRIPVGEHSALIDAVDRDLVAGLNWRPLTGHTGKVYAWAKVEGKGVYMHRLILGTPAGMETDHINGDGLDNRRANLRLATPSQNSANTWKPRRRDGKPATSRFKGVSRDLRRGGWQSKIGTLDPETGKTRTRNLGRYATEEEAARAYDAAALAHWGEFARLNFPREAAA